METGWLIEQADTPTWLRIEDGDYTWTTDSLKAIRFCRKEDAE